MDKRIVLAVFVSVFLLSTIFGKGFVTTVSASATLEGVWSQKSNMTYPRQYPTMGVVNGKIYVVGGRASADDPDAGTRYNYNEMYDPENDTWTTKAPKPTRGDGGASGVVDGKLYVIGQYSSGTENYMYDPIENEWTSKTPMPTKRWDTIGLVLTDPVGNDVIYVIGGAANHTPFKTVEVYCPNNDTWLSKANMNTARAKPGGSVYNGKIYVFDGNWGVPTETCEVYNPSNNTWNYISNPPFEVKCASQVAINNRIYLFRTGLLGKDYTKPNHYCYDPETDKYFEVTDFNFSVGLTPPLERPVVGDTCYIIGGSLKVGEYSYKSKTCYAFTIRENPTPVGGIWISPNKLELLAPWITLASTIISAVAATVVFLKRRYARIIK